MKRSAYLKGTAASLLFASFASAVAAESFNIPGGDLKAALDAYANQTGVSLMVAGSEVQGVRTKGVRGDLSAADALTRILSGTGFTVHRHASGAIGIAKEAPSDKSSTANLPLQLAQAALRRAQLSKP